MIYRKNPGSIVRNGFALFLFGFSFGVVYNCSPEESILFLPLDPRPGSSYLVSYGGEVLASRGSTPEHPEPPEALDASMTSVPSRPGFLSTPGAFCLYSHNEFYYRYEMGLRLAFCSPLEPEKSNQAIKTIEQILYENSPTAHPEFRSRELDIFATGLTDFKKSLPDLRAAYNGLSHSFALENLERQPPALFFSSSGFSEQTAYQNRIFRSFPRSGYQLYLSENAAWIVYPLKANTKQALILKVKNERFYNDLFASLDQSIRITERWISHATGNGSFLSEVAFSSIAGEEFVEFSGTGQASLVQLQLQTAEGFSFQQNLFLFPNATEVVDPQSFPGFRLKEGLSVRLGEQTQVVNKSDLSVEMAIEGRSLLWNTSAWEPSRLCLTGPICGGSGIHPVYEQKTLRTFSANRDSYCQYRDIRSFEFNPFGLSLPERNSLEAGGKFLEVEFVRQCNPENLIFLSGDTIADPGLGLSLHDRLLLFVASDSFYDLPGGRKNSAFRSFQAERGLRVLDLLQGSNHLVMADHTQDSSTNIAYYPGTGAGQSSTLFRSVHSLVLIPDHVSESVSMRFHDHQKEYARLLRPDLQDTHAVSPGLATPDPVCREAELTEISPAGSYTDTGEPIASDEFFEVTFVEKLSSPTICHELMVERQSDGRVWKYRFPSSTEASALAFLRDRPVCWPEQDTLLRWTDLVLPNAAARYTIDGTTPEIAFSLFASLDEDLRYSLMRIDNGDLSNPIYDWIRSDDPDNAAFLCQTATRATPSAPGHYPEHLKQMSQSLQDAVWMVFAPLEEAMLRVEVFDYPGTSIDRQDTTLSHGQLLTTGIPVSPAHPLLPGQRLLVRIQSQLTGRLLASTELYPQGQSLRIDGIGPTPPAGEHEWLRLCSDTGFPLSGMDTWTTNSRYSLILEDTGYTDKLVPYSERFAQAPEFLAHLHTGYVALQPDQCALVVDPDLLSSQSYLPPDERDVALWTVESSSTLGNSLSSGESVLIYLDPEDGSARRMLATYGAPDSSDPFAVNTSGGQYVRRIPGTIYDKSTSYEVAQ